MIVKYATTRPQSPVSQFDVSYPEKLPKIVATRGEISSLKLTMYRSAANTVCSPDIAAIRASTSKGRGGKGGKGGEGEDGGRERNGRRRSPITCLRDTPYITVADLTGSYHQCLVMFGLFRGFLLFFYGE